MCNVAAYNGTQIWGILMNKRPMTKILRVQNLVVFWVLSRPLWTKTTELCFNYYAIIGCFYYGKLEKNIVLKILKSQILSSYY